MYVVTPLHVHLILSSDLHDHVHRRQAHRHAALPCDEERERHRRVEVRAADAAERVDHAHERRGNGQPTSRRRAGDVQEDRQNLGDRGSRRAGKLHSSRSPL